jgi:chemotaxis protein MotB
MSGGGDGLFEEEHAPHENHERYLLTYADMITLLLALFIVLWAISNVDQDKFEEFRAGLAEGFGGPAIDGGNGVLPGQLTVQDPAIQTNGDGDGNATTTTASTVPLGTEGLPNILTNGGGDPDLPNDPVGTDVHVGGGDGVVGFEEATATELQLEGLLRRSDVDPDEANVSVDARGVIVTLNPDFGFEPGSYALQLAALDVLDDLFGPLAEVTNQIQIEGHTDDVPFDGPQGNRGLSNARATSVVEYLVTSGRIPDGRASTVGWGSSQPIADNGTAEGRAANRRIEIVLLVEPGATVPTGVPGTTATTATTTQTGPVVTTTTAPAGGTGTTTTTGSGSNAGETTVTPIDHITQGSFPVPGRD